MASKYKVCCVANTFLHASRSTAQLTMKKVQTRTVYVLLSFLFIVVRHFPLYPSGESRDEHFSLDFHICVPLPSRGSVLLHPFHPLLTFPHFPVHYDSFFSTLFPGLRVSQIAVFLFYLTFDYLPSFLFISFCHFLFFSFLFFLLSLFFSSTYRTNCLILLFLFFRFFDEPKAQISKWLTDLYWPFSTKTSIDTAMVSYTTLLSPSPTSPWPSNTVN